MNTAAEAVLAHGGESMVDKLTAQLEAVRRRWLPMAIAFGVVLAAALAVAALLPATYRSAGIILIEQQEIPEDFVRSAVQSFADQRVQMISQRVMTSSNLLDIIERHGLYGPERLSTPREQLLERIRRDIELKMISADVVDPRRGGVVKATIAFSVAFSSDTADLAARVANDLVSLYLRENLETRKQLAEGSAQFLAGEAERLRQRTDEVAQKISAFKSEHHDRLPELAGANVQQLGRLTEELREVEGRIRSADQQLVFFDAQLAQLDPHAGLPADGEERVLSPQARLAALKSEHAAALARYSVGHPDVRRTAREISRLEQDIAAGGDSADAAASGSSPSNPAYVQIAARRDIAQSERADLAVRRAFLQRTIASSERAQLAMPEIEREYRALLVEAESERAKYAEVRQKLQAAQLSQNLETEQKGERFTLIDPPVRPQEPISPNRGAIRTLGLVLALGAALLTLVAMEMFDGRIRGRRQLVTLLGQPPLAVVPWALEQPAASRHWTRVHLRKLALGGVALASALLLVHFLVRPLNVVLSALIRRLGG